MLAVLRFIMRLLKIICKNCLMEKTAPRFKSIITQYTARIKLLITVLKESGGFPQCVTCDA